MTTFLAELIDGGPNCSRDDCMLQHNGCGTTTMSYYPPTCNKQGHEFNRDKNIITQPMRCLSCGKSWVERWQDGIRISAE